jgi:hypothetical protein
MGAWGEEPYDNDTAGDWFDDTMDKMKIAKRVEKALKSKWENEQRAAAYLLEQLGRVYIYPIDHLERHLAMASVRMQQILDDKEWIGDWKNPRAIRASLRKQIKHLEANYPRHPQVTLEKMKKLMRQELRIE